MWIKYYSLRIQNSNRSDTRKIDNILWVNSCREDFWMYEIIEKPDEDYIDFFKITESILDWKLQQLKKIWYWKGEISLWVLYWYRNQCNLEFTPDQLKFISQNNIALCISCWEE